MAFHTAPAAVRDQIMAERSFMHVSTGQAVHTAIYPLRPSGVN